MNLRISSHIQKTLIKLSFKDKINICKKIIFNTDYINNEYTIKELLEDTD